MKRNYKMYNENEKRARKRKYLKFNVPYRKGALEIPRVIFDFPIESFGNCNYLENVMDH